MPLALTALPLPRRRVSPLPACLTPPPACLQRWLVPPMQAWVRVFDQCMWGMIFFHLLMVGILGLKESIGAPILVAILWIFDLVFW